MKTKFSITKNAGLYLSLFILTAHVLTSCKKNNQATQILGSMGFQYTAPSWPLDFAFPCDTAYLPGKPTDVMNLEVTGAVPAGNLHSTISATIVADTGALNSYNAALSNFLYIEQPYRQLPASYYTLQNGGAVTIKPGQKSISFGINFAGDKIDFFNNNTFRYALSLKLTNAHGTTLASSLSKVVVVISAKNPYAGWYHAVGKTARTDIPDNQSANHSYDIDKPLTVVAQDTVQTYIPDSQSPIFLTINADNSVSINFLQGVPGWFLPFGYFPGLFVESGPWGPYSQNGVNKYDPATKTFTLNYQFLGGVGSVSETLTFMKNL